MTLPAPARDAATVILLRDAAEGPEIFFLQRHAKSGFMAGAHVFPGGAVDPDDEIADPDSSVEICARVFGDAPALAARWMAAAVRETLEEAGVQLRARDLVPWARWITPAAEPRRFDARFFLAAMPEGQHARHDEKEGVSSVWRTPQGAIDDHEARVITLPPPTFANVALLTTFRSAAEALAHARTRTQISPIEPVFLEADGIQTIALPGDPLHPEPCVHAHAMSRFVLRDGRWRAEVVSGAR